MPASSLLLLALTTATDACGVAVWQSEQLQSELTLHRPRRHGQRLVPLARDALAHAEADVGALDAVAVAAGPGSYTGLRIGASAAKGLCRATGAALMPVPTLGALAEAARPFAPQGTLLGAALASRRGEVYTAAFRCGGNALALLQAPEASESDEAAQQFRRLRR
ncbi:MAG: tRNA (adenosine(37)-N6)-threonylcarbamoyltransferase complex dimerization subunit type 1 TsaB, partial [Bacteroidetes bacterium QS_9_68_14]